MPESHLTDDDRRRLVEWYSEGRKLADIEREFDVPRSTIYWILDQAGVTPQRMQRKVRLGDAVSLDWAMERLLLLERENGRLQGENETLQRVNEELRTEVERLKTRSGRTQRGSKGL